MTEDRQRPAGYMEPKELPRQLTEAAADGDISECGKVLAAYREGPDQEALINALAAAAEGGHMAACRLLIERGANLSEDEWGVALTAAVRGGDIEVCRLLLESGAQAFADGDGPLAVAARDGRADICRLLIAGGASFEAAMDRHIQPYEVEEILARLPADATDIARALCAGQGDTCMLKKVRDSNHGLAATFQADAARSKPPARLKPRLSGG